MSDEEDTVADLSFVAWDEILAPSGDSMEVGNDAQWTVSSCKAGNGVQKLRDNKIDTVWQSDGAQPHTISVFFRERMFVECLCFYVDYEDDETYTPNRVCAKVGTMLSDMTVVSTKDLDQPRGWITMPLTDDSGRPSHVFMVELIIIANHQNGRDTHIRQCKIYARSEPAVLPLSAQESLYTFGGAPLSHFNTLR
ncbi:anaphase-promoting complex subunit 10-like [Sycon ciliatum]|uniref:anaphase-promoting complex subunit 10-like n=1 Tax=Sycon ciliatum TaxID=27933 RepID=UPI0031F656D8